MGDTPARRQPIRPGTVLILLLAGGFAIFSVWLKTGLMAEKSPLEKLPLGGPMPDFTLKDTAGREYSLRQVVREKKLVMIDFWASWCGPCRVEMPSFDKLYQKDRKDGLLILAIDEDEDPAKLSAYLKQRPLSFPVLLDPGQGLAKRLGIEAFPTTVLVKQDGRICHVDEGVARFLEPMVEAFLRAPRPAPGKPAVDAGIPL